MNHRVEKHLFHGLNVGWIPFTFDISHNDETGKIRLIVRKLGTNEHDRYTNILPDKVMDFTFIEVVEKFSEIFEKNSLCATLDSII